MNDFEINKAVVEKLTLAVSQPSKISVTVRDDHAWYSFDACNNPSDAWPIIEREDVWGFLMDGSGSDMAYWHISERKLRAAMIVFLKLSDTK